MKVTRYLLIAAGVLAALALLAWFLRDGLIRRISNPQLENYGITVTDVSLDALATSDASISFLQLEHENGTSISIEGLTLPIGAAPDGTKTYSAEKVSILLPERSDDPARLAAMIDSILRLPENLSGSVLHVSGLEAPPYPAVHGLQWRLLEAGQTMQATVQEIVISAAITRIDANGSAVSVSLPDVSTAPEPSISGTLTRGESGFRLAGDAVVDLRPWQPLVNLAGIVPDAVTIESGSAALEFDVGVPYDLSKSPTVAAKLSPSPQMQIRYGHASGETTSLSVQEGSTVEISATFPDVDWALQQDESSLRVTYGDWQDIPVVISELRCESGPSCSLRSRVDTGAANLPIGEVDGMRVSSLQDITFGDEGPHLDIQPGARIEVEQLRNGEYEAEGIVVEVVSTATFDILDNGWRLEAASFDGEFEAAKISDDISVSAPVFLENIALANVDGILSADVGIFAPQCEVEWQRRTVALPGFKGDLARQDKQIDFRFETVGLAQNGSISGEHDLDNGAGSLDIDEVAVSFDSARLSDRISPWQDDWDLTAGSAFLALSASWRQAASKTTFAGESALRVAGLSGYYSDTAFAGLSTSLATRYSDAGSLVAEPSSIAISLIETGLPVENVSADYALDFDEMAVSIDNLRMSAFGGMVSADPFSFHTRKDTNTLMIRARSLSLEELLSLGEFEPVTVSGSIAAVLPVTIAGGLVTIANGILTGEPAGGVIRYRPDDPPAEDDMSSIALVRRALSNFEFDTLNSEVEYGEDGDLDLQLRLTGRNPDMDGNRPVVLNLGVENNVPQLLKSLRAARAVEEILEKRLEE